MPRPKRKSTKSSPPPPAPDPPAETSKSVLGGMNGGYRVTGDEANDAVENFDVAFEQKAIICERRGPKGPPALIFTHGAGGGLSNPATKSFAEGFAAEGPIVSFQGTMNLKSRVKTFHAVIEHEKSGPALGGRSMGARAAVISAQEYGQTEAVVLVSYPLTNQKGEVRDQILLDLPKQVDVLFISGDKDNMCSLESLRTVMKKMTAKAWLVVVEGADHGMSTTPKAAVETMRRHTGSMAAKWLKDRSSISDECAIKWDKEGEEIVQVNAKGLADDKRGAKRKSSDQQQPPTKEVTTRKRQRKR